MSPNHTIQVGLRPVRRARKLCYSKVLQSRYVREDFFFHGTRSHPTVPEPVPTQLVKKPAVREDFAKLCNKKTLHETFLQVFFWLSAYARMHNFP